VSVWQRLGAWAEANLRRSRMESEMDAEMQFHVEARAEDLMRGGMVECRCGSGDSCGGGGIVVGGSVFGVLGACAARFGGFFSQKKRRDEQWRHSMWMHPAQIGKNTFQDVRSSGLRGLGGR
jgi:hypothetical protein